MVQVGSRAPDFSLAGVEGETKRVYSLSETTAEDRYVVLFFYPADFSPVCTPELCAIRDAEFFQFTEDVIPWAISGDTTYAHRAFADQYDLPFPLLSDTDHSVAREYDVLYDEWEDHSEITKRAVFLVDPARTIQYRWSDDDAYVEPDLWPIKDAIDRAMDEDDRLRSPPDTESLEVDYDEQET